MVDQSDYKNQPFMKIKPTEFSVGFCNLEKRKRFAKVGI